MNSTLLMATLVLAATAIGPIGQPTASAANVQSEGGIVETCKAEATQGHLRHLITQRQAVDEHKQRMADLCEGSQHLGAGDREKFLRNCRKEAAWGARSYDRPHMLRLQRLCKRLFGEP